MTPEQLAAHRDNFERAYATAYGLPASVLTLYRNGPGYSVFSMDAAWWAAQWAIADMKKRDAPVTQLSTPPARIHVTEEMHGAAVKVLLRAPGLDGLPQQMMNAMLAAATTTKDAS